ncbi:hypothetical protein [Nocardioides convexus]|uniref:hypothetical protein n=1 Tax=Nocardioides convexus TaxID=2712224 RepID=UPI0024185F83|nr:hypothetical protein [Nocardioides convexus]
MTRFGGVTVGRVVGLSLAALLLGDLGMLLLAPDRSVAWILLPMVLVGLGFGLPVGLVDGHALSVVPAHRAGTAAGLLNFFRIGSEAVFVAGYAAVLSLAVGTRLSGDPAAETAAGQFGHPAVYREAFATTVGALVALLVVLTLAIALAGRRSAADR